MKQKYMASLTRWARWTLPPREAEDVIADYQDIVDDEELFHNLSKPRQAVRTLAQTKPYRIWLAVFAVLAACALLPALATLPGMWPVWELLHRLRIDLLSLDPERRLSIGLGTVLPFLGMAGALVWFRRKGWKGLGRPSPALIALLAAAAACTVAILAVNWSWMRDPTAFSEAWGEMPLYVLWFRIGPPGYTVSRSAHIFVEALEWSGFAMALLSVFALVKARTQDRRWAAVYILTLTAVLLSAETLALFNSMELIETAPGWYLPTLRVWAVYAGVGVVGAGVALC